MRISTAAESRQIDTLAQSEYALPGDILMEAAGAEAAREILQSFIIETKKGKVGVVCGPGNNGGDGLVVARHLDSAGVRGVTVFLVAPKDKRSELFRTQLKRCELQKIAIVDLLSQEAASLLAEQSLLVDAIFGIGLRSEIKSPYSEVIQAINEAPAEVVSLDLPSGLDADRGVLNGVAVKASQTITFGLAKPGFFISDGPYHVGRIKIMSIGFPRELFRRVANSTLLFDEKWARKCLPRRKATGNKARHGHSLILAGSAGMWGAAVLAASAAYRIGSGYVTLANNDDCGELLAQHPEILTSSLSHPQLWGEKRKWNAVLIGPGLGVSDSTLELLKTLKKIGAEKVVVDADAITVIAQNPSLLPLPPSWILTPHAGELARLLSCSSEEIEDDRLRFAGLASEKVGAIVLLKGFRTVIARESVKRLIVRSGNVALAKAGTGDVLAGMMVGFLAQGLQPLAAAATASYIHGRIADDWIRQGKDQRSLVSTDITQLLPDAMAGLARSRSF